MSGDYSDQTTRANFWIQRFALLIRTSSACLVQHLAALPPLMSLVFAQKPTFVVLLASTLVFKRWKRGRHEDRVGQAVTPKHDCPQVLWCSKLAKHVVLFACDWHDFYDSIPAAVSRPLCLCPLEKGWLLDGAGWQRKSDPESLKPFHVQRLFLPFLKGQGEDEITHSLDDWQLHILKYTHARIEQQSKSRTVFNLRIASDSDTWAYSTAEISRETKWWHCWNSPWWWCLCTKNRHFKLGLMIREKPRKFRCFRLPQFERNEYLLNTVSIIVSASSLHFEPLQGFFVGLWPPDGLSSWASADAINLLHHPSWLWFICRLHSVVQHHSMQIAGMLQSSRPMASMALSSGQSGEGALTRYSAPYTPLASVSADSLTRWPRCRIAEKNTKQQLAVHCCVAEISVITLNHSELVLQGEEITVNPFEAVTLKPFPRKTHRPRRPERSLRISVLGTPLCSFARLIT